MKKIFNVLKGKTKTTNSVSCNIECKSKNKRNTFSDMPRLVNFISQELYLSKMNPTHSTHSHDDQLGLSPGMQV